MLRARAFAESISWLMAAGVLACGVWRGARLAWAERLAARGAPAGLARASELAPGSAKYRARLDDWEGALARNRYDSAAWIRLALDAEARGETDRAERLLAEAFRVDRTFETRWALANHYFRRRNWAEFWKWTREAAVLSHGDAGGLLRLCWEAEPDALRIHDRLAGLRPELGAALVSYLGAAGKLDEAAPLAMRLAARGDAVNRDALLDYLGRSLSPARAGQAVELWNALAGSRLVDAEPLDPARGRAITNGDFRRAPLGRAFDWRTPPVPGVSARLLASPPGLRLDFSGRQPEWCPVLEQYVVLAPGRAYRLEFGCRTSGIAAGAGPHWRLLDPSGSADLAAPGAPLAPPDWAEREYRFTAPPSTPLARLTLVYQRVPGSTRIDGAVELRSVRLGFDEAGGRQ